MTFYIKPPKGIINLNILQECVEERLLCYKNLKNENQEVYQFQFQYLVEDSSLDRAGHFVLRYAAYSSSTFQHEFIKCELRLLEARLNSYDEQDFKQFLKRLLKQSREIFSQNENKFLREIYLVFIRVFSFMLRNVYLMHIFNNEHCQGCELFTIKVPYFICLSLVSKRQVDISRGFAEIPCNMWKQFLLSIFEKYLKTILKLMRYCNGVNRSLEDMRLQSVLHIVRKYDLEINPRLSPNRETNLNMTNIFEEMEFFPLCMMSLFKALQKNNRLAHNDRFDFSLYLKGIGMPMSESLKFWEHMYKKEHSTCSRCTHSWQQNEKRYIYGIRHLYGLEGSRRDYQCRDCKYLQEKSIGAMEEGGCPFKQFDDCNLRNLLKSVLPTKPDEIEVMIYERHENPNTACQIFLETVYELKTNKSLNQNIVFSNPVDYYLQLKKEINTATGINNIQ